MPETISNEEKIFTQALELDETKRREFVEKACESDTKLKKRILSLLDAEQKSSGYLDTFQPESFPIAQSLKNSAPTDEKSGDTLGNYKLLEVLGEGSWGVVWMVEQREPVRRRLALKILKLGLNSKEIVARFESERQALAMMTHPNIAKVFDAGTTPNGRPFFAMELIRGPTITNFADQENLSTRERLKLFIKVCHAVQHAHQRGIIHRDLKPSNILVDQEDKQPVPKIIDFGIVKATEQRLTNSTLFTQFHSFIGTPTYTSPEQIRMSRYDVDTRSDVYSLGVVLYELLSGIPPFDAETLSGLGIDAMRKVITEEDPPKLSAQTTIRSGDDLSSLAQKHKSTPEQLTKRLRGDLECITMKCLQKSRSQRYESVNALVADIERYLANETIQARPPSTFYKLSKLYARNKIAFGLSSLLAACLLIGGSTAGFFALKAYRLDKQSRVEMRKNAEIMNFVNGMFNHVPSLVEMQVQSGADGELLQDTLKETFDLASNSMKDLTPEIEVEILDLLGAMYFKIREYKSAESTFRLELEKAQQLDPPNTQSLARAYNHLGATLGRIGSLEEARERILSALQVQKAAEFDLNPDLDRTLVNLGVIQARLARQSGLSVSERYDLLAQARGNIEQALSHQRTRLGLEHEEIAATLNELGFILTCEGGANLRRAESCLLEALEMNRVLLGEATPATAASMNLLSICEAMQGDYSKAFHYYLRSKSIRESLKNTPSTNLLNTGDLSVWEHRNTTEEGLTALHIVAEFQKQRFPSVSLEVGGLLSIQAWAYNEEGRFELAENAARECLIIRERGEPDLWTPYHTHSLLGTALLGQGRFEEAEPHLLRGYLGVKKHRDLLGDGHKIRLNECLLYLIKLYQVWEKPQKTKQWLEEAKELGITIHSN